jgi:phosphatidylglycerophosphate synthase
MITAIDFLEPRICRRRCEDHSNDLENPLLEATSSSTAEGENKQESSSKVDPYTPHPKRLMLALFFALFIEIMAITIAIQISSQGQEYLPAVTLGGILGLIVDMIAIGVICLGLAHPKRLMLALFFALFIEIMAITMAVQISSQGQDYLPLVTLGGMIGPIVDMIVICVIFLGLAHPKRLMLALFFALFIEIVAITMAVQISLQRQKYLPL